MIAVNVVCDYW